MRVPLFRDHPSFRRTRPGPLAGKRVLAAAAPTECDARSVRRLWRRLRPLGVELKVTTECHGEARAESGRPLFPALLLVEARPEAWDALIFVGGAGAARMARDPFARELANRFAAAGKILGALGEGTVVLAAAQLGGLREEDPDELVRALARQLGLPAPARAPLSRPV